MDRALAVGLPLLAAWILSGCTAIPKAEFQAYRDASSRAAESAKSIYVDFAPTYRAYPKASSSAAPAGSTLAQIQSLRVTIDTGSGLTEEEAFIGARIRALDMVQTYNDALADLAEGKNTPDLIGAFSGLLGQAQNFPWKTFGEATAKSVAGGLAKAVPYVQAVEPLIQELEKEIVRREFIRAAQVGGKRIREQLLPALFADAQDMYDALR